ncbi:hypothetical protein [Mesorhizobium sp.]|uniref:hypothetical protein n=1 Tax=Mesorhizobium sp. TaxID=1871066 RepID=UPI0025D1EB79|nr:hypothetical protein [Mesorhizobium sp.]
MLDDLPNMSRPTARQTVRPQRDWVRPTRQLRILRQSSGDQDDWHTLVDLSGGQFVARLLAGDEMFARSKVNFRCLLPPRRHPCPRGLHRKL